MKSYAVGLHSSEGGVGVGGGGREVLESAPGQGRVQHARGGEDRVEHGVALGAVVEDPEPAADDGLALTRQVVDDTEPGRDLERGPAVQPVVDALAGLGGPVEPLRVGRGRNEPSDEALHDGVGGVGRVHADPVATRARIGTLAGRVVQRRGAARAPPVGQEGGHLERTVPLRRQGVEAHAVVDRQPAVHLPVVLAVPLDVRVDVVRPRVLVRLREGVEDPERRVRVAEVRVVRVARAVDEADLGVVAGERALRLQAVLEVDAELGVVVAPDLGQVGDRVVRLVDVRERVEVRLVIARAPAHAPAVESHVGDGVDVDRVRVESGEGSEARARARHLRVLELVVERVSRAPDAQLERHRVAEDAGGGEHPVPAGVYEVGPHVVEVVAARAGPGGAVGLLLVVRVPHVPARDAPLVGGLEVDAEQLLVHRQARSPSGSRS